MKPIIDKDLMKRLVNAASNGSKVAEDLIALFEKTEDIKDITGKTVNYFGSKRIIRNGDSSYKTVNIKITVCAKDLDNDHFPDKGNPKAPYFRENRTDVDPSTFVGYFAKALPDYTEEDIQYFDSALRVGKVELIYSSDMSDIERAYNGENYAPISQGASSCLHNSCMRHDVESRNTADFYANFANASILYAVDEDGGILGRCMIWEKCRMCGYEEMGTFSFMDRQYYCFDFIRIMMTNYAKDVLKINFKKTLNDYSSHRRFDVMNPIKIGDYDFTEGLKDVRFSVKVAVSSTTFHKEGCPYLDTFRSINYDDDAQELYLTNKDADSTTVLATQTTGGYATLMNNVCPICGKLHTNGEGLCSECRKKFIKRTIFGEIFTGKTKEYKGQLVEESMVVRGKMSKPFEIATAIKKCSTGRM